jgi:hypothetical protein
VQTFGGAMRRVGGHPVAMAEQPARNPRDRHYFDPGPKRLLALDGGGVRGVIAVAFLEEIEKLLSAHTGAPVRLGDWFDLVGGTSTGAVIAGALALGYRTEHLKTFYMELAPRVFRRSFKRLQGWHAKFDAEQLRQEIVKVVGDRKLDSEDLITGLSLVTKRLDTGSAWIIANNPAAPYWNTPPDGSFIGNRHFPLANLVRASTAAPFYFDPELLPIVDGMPDGLFLDGAITPHNNPALIMFLMTRLKRFGISWPTGADRLLICSVGTGNYRTNYPSERAKRASAIELAGRALATLIGDAATLNLTLMQWLGQSPTAWSINSEIGDLAEDLLPGGPMFRFLRYDTMLEAPWLREVLDIDVSEAQVERLHQLDDSDMVALAYKIGVATAKKYVRLEHLLPPAQVRADSAASS